MSETLPGSRYERLLPPTAHTERRQFPNNAVYAVTVNKSGIMVCSRESEKEYIVSMDLNQMTKGEVAVMGHQRFWKDQGVHLDPPVAKIKREHASLNLEFGNHKIQLDYKGSVTSTLGRNFIPVPLPTNDLNPYPFMTHGYGPKELSEMSTLLSIMSEVITVSSQNEAAASV